MVDRYPLVAAEEGGNFLPLFLSFAVLQSFIVVCKQDDLKMVFV
jgi:hypothetical protein